MGSRLVDRWPKTASGLPSTSGCTATVLFIKGSQVYIGHVGDSSLVVGYTKNPTDATYNGNWLAKKLTKVFITLKFS